jgi:hypothetical protein
VCASPRSLASTFDPSSSTLSAETPARGGWGRPSAEPTRSLHAWTLRVLRVVTAAALDPHALAAFRDAYVGSFRPNAAGFLDMLRALVPSE